MRNNFNGNAGCSILVFNEATMTSYIILGSQVFQSFYATFSYNADGSNELVTLSLSQNAWPLANLNGYDAVTRKVSANTLLQVLLISGFAFAGVILMILLHIKMRNTVDSASHMETASEALSKPSYDYESSATVQGGQGKSYAGINEDSVPVFVGLTVSDLR